MELKKCAYVEILHAYRCVLRDNVLLASLYYIYDGRTMTIRMNNLLSTPL